MQSEPTWAQDWDRDCAAWPKYVQAMKYGDHVPSRHEWLMYREGYAQGQKDAAEGVSHYPGPENGWVMELDQTLKLEMTEWANKMDKSDGGPAFPYVDGAEPVVRGMSLRDYFAGQVLQGLAANPELRTDVNFATIAERCYSAADAMLAEREK